VRQPIFSGFREFYNASANKADIKARKLDKERAYQLLYLDVADVFYQILMYERDLKLLREIETSLEKRVSDFNKRVELGKSRSGDLYHRSSSSIT
jgi:outer membrane protein